MIYKDTFYGHTHTHTHTWTQLTYAHMVSQNIQICLPSAIKLAMYCAGY